VLVNDFYVDDCLKAVDTPQQAIVLVKELKGLLAKGGFRLTKWTCNSKAVLDEIPLAERSKQAKARTFDSPLEERALGVYWNVEDDCFGYYIKAMDKPLTKRGLLSMLSSIYDPLGLASPFILVARRIVQKLCSSKLAWDQPIGPVEKLEWSMWVKDLENMKNVRIPRCIQPLRPRSRCLHHFADASEMAYGVASYLVTVDDLGHYSSALVMAKSRLAPMNPVLTIPRLELQAATLATRQDELLRRELDVELTASQFWTDSTTVLQYIRNEERRFHTFVANRVAEIRARTDVADWRHVDTKLNPADDTSRGLLAAQLNDMRWQQGPEFLRKPSSEWPDQDVGAVEEDDPAVKKTKPLVLLTQAQAREHAPLDKLIAAYSTWRRLARGVAWIILLKNLCLKRAQPTPCLTHQHVTNAEETLIRHAQAEHYSDEIRTLALGHRITRTSKLFKLQPHLDRGLLVCGGRLQNAGVPEHAKCPYIIPRDHRIAHLIVQHAHEASAHAGREFVLARLREHYWIPGASVLVRRLLRKCFACNRREPRPCTQRMADLPTDRVTPGDAAFTHVGLDYFGPFLVTRGRGTEKRYGCLFTCLVTRAVHIEVAYRLDTSSFINCLSRFLARRGTPRLIRSDNGTNFVGAERVLKAELENWQRSFEQMEALQKGVTQHNITWEWKYNPPHASHMGGVWERQIRTIRRVLGGLTREQRLTDESLVTLLTMAEGIVNNRPLTAVSDDPTDLEPLTPNHLLILKPSSAPPGIYTEQDLSSHRRWRQVQYLADLFWRRWTKEYLPLLRQRTRWQTPTENVRVGDLVVVVDYLLPRNQWLLARVLETLPGSDGLVRTVRIRTATAEMIRPVAKLCLLETNILDEGAP